MISESIYGVYGNNVCLLYALSFYFSLKVAAAYVRADGVRVNAQSFRGYLNRHPSRRSADIRDSIRLISDRVIARFGLSSSIHASVGLGAYGRHSDGLLG